MRRLGCERAASRLLADGWTERLHLDQASAVEVVEVGSCDIHPLKLEDVVDN